MNRFEIKMIQRLKREVKPLLGNLRIDKTASVELHEDSIRTLIALVQVLVKDDCCFTDLVVSRHGEFLCFTCYNMDDDLCLLYIWSPVKCDWQLIDIP